MSASPGSRLSDDLYSLYLAGLGWLILPFYGDGLAEVLPSNYQSVDRGVDILVAVVVASALWSGWRGGPLLVSRAGVIHELASGASRRAMLYPRLLRQITARAAIAAVGASLGLALSIPGEYSVGPSVTISVVAALAAALNASQSMLWHVAWSGGQRPNPVLVSLSAIAPGVCISLSVAKVSFFSGAGLGTLAGLTAASVSASVYLLDRAPIDRLWGRARALETMRSSMQTVDFQQMLLEVRRATDSQRRVGPALARAWMPTPLWRQVAALQHGLLGQLARLSTSCIAIVVLLRFADPGQGIVALVLAGCIALIGVDLAVPIGSTASQLTFLVHYRNGSARVLQGQMFTAVLVAMVIGGVVTATEWGVDVPTAQGVLLLFFVGTLASLMQARLGSPDVASWATTLGPASLGPLLWARALLGPLMLLGATIAISHQYLRPDSFGSGWMQITAFIAFALAGVTMNPLEKSLR